MGQINMTTLSNMVDERDKTIKKLREAVKKYGWHRGQCPKQPIIAKRYARCDCGFDAVLRKANDD